MLIQEIVAINLPKIVNFNPAAYVFNKNGGGWAAPPPFGCSLGTYVPARRVPIFC